MAIANPAINSSKPLPLRDPVRSRAQMDTLRFGSILLIMIHHFYYLHKPVGTIGTHFFFALTGFLVANSLMKLREQVLEGKISGWKAAFQFTTRRWMRILPVMWLMLTTLFLFFKHFDRSTAAWHYLLASNIRMAIDNSYPENVAHLWWISAMEQTLPFIILLFMITPKHYLQKAIACMILIGPAFRLYAYFNHWNYISMRVLPPAFIDIVGMGCLLAVAMKYKNDHLISVIKWVGVCVGLPMTFFALWYIHLTANDLMMSVVFDLGSTWAVCWLIIVSYNGMPGVIGNILAWPPLAYLGAISYGLAMWHLSAMSLMMKYFPGANPNIRAAGSFLLAVIIASLTYFLIERPIGRIKHAEPKAKPVKSPKPARTFPDDLEDVELAK